MNIFGLKPIFGRVCLGSLMILLMLASPVSAEDPLTSARTIGLGNIHGFNFSSEAIFENPASLQLRSNVSVSSFFTTYMGGENKSMVLTAAYTLSPGFVVGVGYIQNTIDGLFYTRENSDHEYESTGTFGYKEAHYSLGASVSPTDELSFGISGAYLSQAFGSDNGSRIQFDAGTFYRAGNVGYSLVAKNILAGKMEFNDGSSQNTFRQLVLSAGYQPKPGVGISVFAQITGVIGANNLAVLKGIGGGYYLVPHRFQIRGGWREIYSSGKISSSPSMGIGFELSPFTLNYAYEISGAAVQSDTHFLSIQADL